MKKIFTLFAAAVLGLCAFAQDDQPCPSKLGFAVINADDPSQVEVELQLVNSSLNLNGFNIEVQKAEGSEAVKFKRVNWKWFTAEGYGTTILSRLDAPDDIKESMLSDFCDVQSNWKSGSDRLVIIEILKTNDCRFFPVLEEPAGIGKFWLDFTDCPDGEYKLFCQATPETCLFSYTGGVEGTRAWTTDEEPEIIITKNGDVIEAINTVTVDLPVDNRIFDLQGRQLQSVPEHGIYIQNGKKYVK